MRKVYLVALFGLLLMPVLAAAQSAFDGTWKVDMNKVDFPKKPDVYPAAKRHVRMQDVRAAHRSQSRRHRTRKSRAIPTTTRLQSRS